MKANSVGDRLNRYDLAAKTNDGLIEEIYPDVREEMEILNIKRGILSALQIQVTEKRQTKIVRNDLSIHGNCSSDMSISKLKGDDLTTVFNVTRDLTSCTINTTQDENVWLMLSPSMVRLIMFPPSVHFDTFQAHYCTMLSSSVVCIKVAVGGGGVGKVCRIPVVNRVV